MTWIAQNPQTHHKTEGCQEQKQKYRVAKLSTKMEKDKIVHQ